MGIEWGWVACGSGLWVINLILLVSSCFAGFYVFGVDVGEVPDFLDSFLLVPLFPLFPTFSDRVEKKKE
jgi:hypothetical protein